MTVPTEEAIKLKEYCASSALYPGEVRVKVDGVKTTGMEAGEADTVTVSESITGLGKTIQPVCNSPTIAELISKYGASYCTTVMACEGIGATIAASTPVTV
jgi:hypothetical protein